jgi:hypothetical protein
METHEFTTGAIVNSEKVGVMYNSDFDDGVDVFIDVGQLEAGRAGQDVFQQMLEMNIELWGNHGESFGLHSETGHILFRSFFREDEVEVDLLGHAILGYVDLVRELREGLPVKLVHGELTS